MARINAISNVTFMTFYMASKNNEHIVGLCSQFDIAPAHSNVGGHMDHSVTANSKTQGFQDKDYKKSN